jgi:hypothetical protein
MKVYKSVPMWWFLVILVANIALIIFACEYYNETLQLPWWGVLLACAIAIFFTLPIGVIAATTNQVNICQTIKFNPFFPTPTAIAFALLLNGSSVETYHSCASLAGESDARFEHYNRIHYWIHVPRAPCC